ncbi:uncharacterized protein prr14 [Betta splendens]|uniref:Uncharacterized protein prr14 n=1 Tax=Betta splendens TaxID=158456 RepID=A0A6P7N6P7_BETSP|nr:uncharacterized protein prr14 [Betta splendens]
MLTCPSDSLPHIVCPMDGDAIPPIPFCSAPSHSDPPPPLLPLPSITPSHTNDGIPEQRRSGCIQGIRAHTENNTDGDSVQEPSKQNPTPTHQREGESMVSPSKQLRVESTKVHVKQNEDGFRCSYTAEHTNNQTDQESHDATEDVVEHCAFNAAQHHTDMIKCDMDTSQGLDMLLENASAQKGWVIGPLFQSFKSKMASFTEIVMSPFKASSPPPSMEHPQNFSECELPTDGPSEMGDLEPGGRNESSEMGPETKQQSLSDMENTPKTQTVDIKCLKKLSFGEESTPSLEKTDECGKMFKEANCHDSVPLQHSPILCFPTETLAESVEPVIGSSVLFQASVDFSTSHKSKLVSTVDKDKQTAPLKPLSRKRMGNSSESKPLAPEFKKEKSDLEANNCSGINKTVPLSATGCDTQPGMECLQTDGDEGMQVQNSHLVRQSLRISANRLNGRTVKCGKDLQVVEYLASGSGRAKRGLRLPRHATGNICTNDAMTQELMNVATGIDLTREPSRREAVSSRTVLETENPLKPATKRRAHSTRTRKDRGGQEMLPTVIGAVLKTETQTSEARFVCSLDKSSDVSGNLQNVFSSINSNPTVLGRRLKIRADLVEPDLSIDDGMDLETTVAITSAKEGEQLSSEAFIRPDTERLQSKRRNPDKKPLRRRSPVQTSSGTESDLVFTSSAEPSELMAMDLNVSLPVQREKKVKMGLNRPPKRKKGLKDSLQSSESIGGQEKKHRMDNVPTKKRQAREDGSKTSRNPVYLEMTSAPSYSQPPSSCPALLNNDIKVHETEKRPASFLQEVVPTETGASKLNSTPRNVNVRPRRADRQRGKAAVLHSRTRKAAETPTSVTMEDADLPRSPPEGGAARRLLRSYSCPEIPSFRSHETPPHPCRTPTSHHRLSPLTPHVPHPRKSAPRARRHTVCSIEVEREIAPLCLRKEVYPSRRSAPYDFVPQHLSPTVVLSYNTTLSALASCFLSSSLAFLSKKVDGRCSAASPSTFSSSRSPGFFHNAGSPHATVDPSSSTTSLECEPQSRHKCEVEYAEDTSCSSQEYEDVGLREEKALSDSEIKVVQKHEEKGKVSSIRIRKTLPKPQNNLTPMGLPKPVRLKKKDFSLEEIYTNKNFSKPPESRLETIFEVPLSRRNGSESMFGQRRVKRFLEFLEAGEVRKSKKPLVGVGKPAGSSSRTRRGGFSKDEPPLSAQDVDSLLCAKLHELNLWLITDQGS